MDIAAESLAKHAEWRGKLAFDPKMDIATRHDLAVAYTPGRGRALPAPSPAEPRARPTTTR